MTNTSSNTTTVVRRPVKLVDHPAFRRKSGERSGWAEWPTAGAASLVATRPTVHCKAMKSLLQVGNQSR
jgi:hypothetical protein